MRDWMVASMVVLLCFLPGTPSAAQALGWQDQRYAAPKMPGRSLSELRQLRREHDAPRRNEAAFALGDDIMLRGGRAYLFRKNDSQAEYAAHLDGKGAHFVITWP